MRRRTVRLGPNDKVWYTYFMINPQAQTMRVTVEFLYDEEVFDGDTDMYAVAAEALEYIKDDMYHTVAQYDNLSNLRVKVTPKLS